MSKKLKILVCCHKADPNIRTEEPYLPIQVGKALHPELDLGFICDNEGDNISEKNGCWCELTALYWGWKNLHDVSYIGLCHYRRYFDCVISEQNIEKLLGSHDIIVVKQDNKMWSKNERVSNLMNATSREDFYIYMDTMLSVHPEFRKEIIEYFYNSRDSVPFTMFISQKQIYDGFCRFIFPVFEKIEQKAKEHGYTRQKRYIAYFGEYSLGLYIHCMHLKPKRIPLFYSGDTICYESPLKSTLKKFFRNTLRCVYILLVDSMRPRIKEIAIPEDVKVGFRTDGVNMEVLE